MLQFVVLLAIMALWALTSLLSREAQPLPPRPARGPGPDGLRPALPCQPGRRDGPVASRQFARSTGSRRSSAGMPARWSEAAAGTSARAGPWPERRRRNRDPRI